jgi:hypothetical protein
MEMGNKDRSLIAEFFYTQTKFQKGSASELIVSEIDKLWQKGKDIVTIDELTSIVENAHPELKKKLKSVKGRVKKVISWGESKSWENFKELITREGDSIVIISRSKKT